MSNILNQLSSQKGERTGESNKNVAEQCLSEPGLLKEIRDGLKAKDRKLIADCAEVMTLVAEKKPEYAQHYADDLTGLIHHKDNRVRWEIVHAIAYITQLIPDHVQYIIPEIEALIVNDKSIIVRDYCSLIFENYASINRERALEIYPRLKSLLEIWGERHAKQALMGLFNVYNFAPELGNEIKDIAEKYLNAKKKTVQSAAKKILKQINV